MFIRYQCTTCRRTIDQPLDAQHVQPDLCVITKGCQGRLLPIAKVTNPETTAAVAGLTDWYPRGQVRGGLPAQAAEASTSLSNSDTGTITIALRTQAAGELGVTSTALNLLFEQRVTGTIPFQQYEYRVTAGTTVVTGRDLSGRVMRFDQLAIDEDRVLVRVNGVERVDRTLTPNTVTFNSALGAADSVAVLVYAQQQVVERVVPVTRHDGNSALTNPGAWSNIRFVKRHDPAVGYQYRWYIFSTQLPLMAYIPADGSLRLTGVKTQETNTDALPDGDLNGMIFLLSNYPWKNIDRYYNFSVEGGAAGADFNLRCVTTGGVKQLLVSDDLLREEFPALLLELTSTGDPGLSYISADVLDTSASSLIVTDGETARKHAHYVLGPV